MTFSSASIPVEPFTVNHSTQEIDDLKTLLRLSPLDIETYENREDHAHAYGPSLAWMKEMKSSWLSMEWESTLADLNHYPQFIAQIPDVDPKTGDKETFNVHFVGIESQDPNAIPVIIMHGWPGSFYEILPLVPVLLRANPSLHIIIPSLIGFSYSSSAPLDREFGTEGTARVFNSLMKGLGYHKYVAQGGDLGSCLARIMAIRYDECQAIHVNNFVPAAKPPSIISKLAAPLILTDADKRGLERSEWFASDASAYAAQHATRPATIGYAIASSPVALLAWIGEKFIHWTDNTPSHTHMITWLSIYWLTRSYPSSVFYYRDPVLQSSLTTRPGLDAKDLTIDLKGMYVDKPIGFSRFPKDLSVVPKSWAESTGQLVFYKEHQVGGHFASTEQPELMGKDLIDFLDLVWIGEPEKDS